MTTVSHVSYYVTYILHHIYNASCVWDHEALQPVDVFVIDYDSVWFIHVELHACDGHTLYSTTVDLL